MNNCREFFRGPVALCRLFLKARVAPGDRVVDATCGNGHDTVFLAELVGQSGRVWSFDIDADALDVTGKKLRKTGIDGVVDLIQAGHECLGQYVDEPVQAVVFNLGYLPGSTRTTVTKAGTTIAALNQAVSVLLSRGVIIVSIYTGHSGGAEEGRAVDAWAAALPTGQFNVWRSHLLNRREDAPYLILIEKML